VKIINIDHLGRVHPDQFWRAATFGNVRDGRWPDPRTAARSAQAAHPVPEGRCGACRVEHCRGSHRERALAHRTTCGGGSRVRHDRQRDWLPRKRSEVAPRRILPPARAAVRVSVRAPAVGLRGAFSRAAARGLGATNRSPGRHRPWYRGERETESLGVYDPPAELPASTSGTGQHGTRRYSRPTALGLRHYPGGS
jgi:hypothetical protein